MDGRNEFRAGLFPSGPCVTDESIEAPGYENQTSQQLFETIDAGNADERMLVLAKRACETCIQFQNGHCTTQAEEVATELWRRGAGVQFIGGRTVSVQNAERPLSDEQPAFNWDLSVIPREPADALDILRQGLRSGQFKLRGSFNGVVQTGEKYLKHIQATDPELHKLISQLSPEDQEQGLKNILVPLFQQKDYVNFSCGKRAPQPEGGRYNPQYFDTETDSEIISLYFKEVIRVSDLGLSRPAQKAIYFNSDFYIRLIDRKPDGLAFKAFDKLISDAPRMPLAAIEKYEQSRNEALRQAAPSTYVKSAALNRHRGNYDATVSDLYTKYPDLPRQIVRQVCAKHPNNPAKVLDGVTTRLAAETEAYGNAGAPVKEAERALLVTRYTKAEDYLAALEKFSANIAELTKRFGKNSELTPREIRNFSLLNLNDAVGAAVTFKERLAQLRNESDGSVPESALRKAARTSGEITFEDVRKKHAYTLIRDRYALRSKREGREKLTPNIVERITSLYPRALADAAAESTYALINVGSLLVATADFVGLGGRTHEDLDKIFSPKSREYITFPASLRGLTPVQRLGFAIHHGLTPILYGRDINQLQFEQAVLSHSSLADFYETAIAPQVAELSQGEQNTTPLSLLELSTDIAAFDKLLENDSDYPLPHGDNRVTFAGLRDATLVVGGKALYLHEKDYDWAQSKATSDFTDWLTQKVASNYPPHQQEQAFTYVQDAITTGAIELIGDNPGEFRLVFSHAFYDEHVTEIDRAAVANAMGVDRILYGSDLTNAVRYRLGNTQQTVSINRMESPNVIAFTDDDLAETEKELDYEAMGFAQLPPLQQILITVFGKDVRLDNVTDRQWQKIGDDLLNAYSRHIENPNHQHEVRDDYTRAQVALAWTYARGGDVNAQARLFSTASEELSEHINAGLAFILEQFAQIPTIRLSATAKILGIGARPETTSKPDQMVAALSEVTVKKIVTVSMPNEPPQLAGPKIAPSQNSELPELVERPVKKSAESRVGHSLVKNYLLTVGNYPKLTAEQENQCAQEIQAGLAAQVTLDEGNLSEQKISELQALITSGAHAKTRLIEANLRIVPYMVHILPPTYGMSDMDYIQAGNIGLMQAAERYLPGDVRFKTYANHYVAKYMRLAHRENFLPVTSEPSIAEKAYYYRGFATHMLDHEGRLPTDEEAMKNLKCSSKVLAKIKLAAQSSASYADIFETSEVHKMSGPATVTNQQPKSSLDKQQETAHAALNYMVRSVLTDAGLVREAAALILANGLYLDPEVVPPGAVPGQTYTNAEGAKILGVSRATFNRAVSRALSIMSQPATKRQLSYLLGETDSPY